MQSTHRDERLLGVLLLLQLAGLIVPFIMLGPVASPGFLATAATNAGQIRFGLLLLLTNGALTVGISSMLRRRTHTAGPSLGRWLLVLGAAMLVLQAVDNMHVLGMLATSEAHATASQTVRAVLETQSGVLAATRQAAHYTTLLAIGSWMLVFYAACWRARVAPWPFAVLGLLAATVHVAGVSMPVLLGASASAPMAMGLAASHVALAGWLITRRQVRAKAGDRLPPSVHGVPS